MELFGLEGTLKLFSFQPPAIDRDTLPYDLIAQSLIQTGFKHFQGWAIFPCNQPSPQNVKQRPSKFFHYLLSHINQNQHFNFQTKPVFLSTKVQNSWLCHNHPIQLSQTIPAQMCRGLDIFKLMQRIATTRQSDISKNPLVSCRIRR